MPHVEGMSLRTVWTAGGESRFARPVAAATGLAQRAMRTVVTALAPKPRRASPPAHARKEREVRALEAHYARATDRHDLERMERDWDRRDGGGMRAWDSR